MTYSEKMGSSGFDMQFWEYEIGIALSRLGTYFDALVIVQCLRSDA